MPEQEQREEQEQEPRRLGEVVDILLDVQRHLREEGFPEEVLEAAEDEKPGKGRRRNRGAKHPEQPRTEQTRVALRERSEEVVNLPEPREEPPAYPASQSEPAAAAPEPPTQPEPQTQQDRDSDVEPRAAALDAVVQKRVTPRSAARPAAAAPRPAPAAQPTHADKRGSRARRQLTAGERLAAEVAQDLGMSGDIALPAGEEAPRPWEDDEPAGTPKADSIEVRLFRLEKEIQAIFDEVSDEEVRLLQLDGMFTDWVSRIRALLIKRNK